MKLMTKAIEKALPKLYATDGQDTKKVAVKFFLTGSAWTWYVVEGEQGEYEVNPMVDDGPTYMDWKFFGLVVNGYGEQEWGYFMLSDLQRIRNRFGLGVERDMYFTGQVSVERGVVEAR